VVAVAAASVTVRDGSTDLVRIMFVNVRSATVAPVASNTAVGVHVDRGGDVELPAGLEVDPLTAAEERRVDRGDISRRQRRDGSAATEVRHGYATPVTE
jgi:hypothetical protein